MAKLFACRLCVVELARVELADGTAAFVCVDCDAIGLAHEIAQALRCGRPVSPPMRGLRTSDSRDGARGGKEPPMTDELTAEQVRALLELEPNATCGFVRTSYLSAQSIAPGGLPAPFADGRPMGSALYFMVTPSAPVRLHRIRNDQLYHYYLGDPLEVLLLNEDATTARVVVGPNLRRGEHLQLLIPGNTFHTACLTGRGRWFLGASTEWPGVAPADVEIGDLDALAAKYPAVAGDLRAIAESVRPT